MQFELDTHTHTIASAHAYSTVQEMAQAAAREGAETSGHHRPRAGTSGFQPNSFTLWDYHVLPKGTVWCTDDVWRGVKYHGF